MRCVGLVPAYQSSISTTFLRGHSIVMGPCSIRPRAHDEALAQNRSKPISTWRRLRPAPASITVPTTTEAAVGISAPWQGQCAWLAKSKGVERSFPCMGSLREASKIAIFRLTLAQHAIFSQDKVFTLSIVSVRHREQSGRRRPKARYLTHSRLTAYMTRDVWLLARERESRLPRLVFFLWC